MTNEISGDEAFFSDLRKKLKQANSFPGSDPSAKHQLITNELEQAALLSFMDTSIYKLASAKDRELNEIVDKITGLHDSSQEVEKRKQSIGRIASLLRENDGNKSSIYWLNKFDDAMCNVKKGLRLRDTQKMAILCAIESEKHVLEQVNTGEGKKNYHIIFESKYDIEFS